MAINGNADVQFEQNSCSHTDIQNEPWWIVTFKYHIIVSEVLIANDDDDDGKVLVNVLFSFFFQLQGGRRSEEIVLNGMSQFKVI